MQRLAYATATDVEVDGVACVGMRLLELAADEEVSRPDTLVLPFSVCLPFDSLLSEVDTAAALLSLRFFIIAANVRIKSAIRFATGPRPNKVCTHQPQLHS